MKSFLDYYGFNYFSKKRTMFLNNRMNHMGLFTALNCFMVSHYLTKKIMKPIPKKYCSFTENEDFFATKEVLASAICPRLLYSNLLNAYHLEDFYGLSFIPPNRQLTSCMRFKEKTRLSKKLFRKISEEARIINDIFIMMDDRYIEFSPFNLMVKSYQRGILQLVPIDCGKKYWYKTATPINVSFASDEEVIRNFFVEHEQHKKEIYDKLVRHPFYEAYMRTHFIKEQAPDMFRDFGLAEVVKPVFV